MCADVLVENSLLPKVFPALRTFVRLLTRVYAQVLIEDGPLSKRALTVHARVRLFIGVDAKMLRQVRLLAESFAALWTPVGPTVRVDTLVLKAKPVKSIEK